MAQATDKIEQNIIAAIKSQNTDEISLSNLMTVMFPDHHERTIQQNSCRIGTLRKVARDSDLLGFYKQPPGKQMIYLKSGA